MGGAAMSGTCLHTLTAGKKLKVKKKGEQNQYKKLYLHDSYLK